MTNNSTTSNGPTDGIAPTGGAVRRPLRRRLFGWLIADDPNPEYSRLDRMDGLGRERGRDFIVTSDDGITSPAVQKAIAESASQGRDVTILDPKTGTAVTYTPADVLTPAGTSNPA